MKGISDFALAEITLKMPRSSDQRRATTLSRLDFPDLCDVFPLEQGWLFTTKDGKGYQFHKGQIHYLYTDTVTSSHYVDGTILRDDENGFARFAIEDGKLRELQRFTMEPKAARILGYLEDNIYLEEPENKIISLPQGKVIELYESKGRFISHSFTAAKCLFVVYRNDQNHHHLSKYTTWVFSPEENEQREYDFPIYGVYRHPTAGLLAVVNSERTEVRLPTGISMKLFNFPPYFRRYPVTFTRLGFANNYAAPLLMRLTPKGWINVNLYSDMEKILVSLDEKSQLVVSKTSILCYE